MVLTTSVIKTFYLWQVTVILSFAHDQLHMTHHLISMNIYAKVFQNPTTLGEVMAYTRNGTNVQTGTSILTHYSLVIPWRWWWGISKNRMYGKEEITIHNWWCFQLFKGYKLIFRNQECQCGPLSFCLEKHCSKHHEQQNTKLSIAYKTSKICKLIVCCF